MKSNMNSMTKTLLFFLIIFIVCDRTLSDDVKDCMDNIHKVFFYISTPFQHFSMALGAFSEYFFEKGDLNVIEDLYSHFLYSTDFVRGIDQPYMFYKHEEVVNYYHNFKSHYLFGNTSGIELGEGSPATLKADLIGYFKSLVDKIGGLSLYFNSTDTCAPEDYCKATYIEDSSCKEALMIMFDLKNDPQKDTKFKSIKGIDGLKHCYLKHAYLEFTIERFFPELSKKNQNSPEVLEKKYLIGIMMRYYNNLLYFSTQIINMHEAADPMMFPSVEEYCRTLRKSKTGMMNIEGSHAIPKMGMKNIGESLPIPKTGMDKIAEPKAIPKAGMNNILKPHVMPKMDMGKNVESQPIPKAGMKNDLKPHVLPKKDMEKIVESQPIPKAGIKNIVKPHVMPKMEKNITVEPDVESDEESDEDLEMDMSDEE